MRNVAKPNETTVTFKVFNKEYRQGIKEMENDGKVLRQELKLEQEQLKYSGSETDKLTSSLLNLEKQYELSQKKTQATSEALNEAKGLFGENSEAVSTMEKALRSAEISEQQLANKIITTKEKLEEAKKSETDRVQTLKNLESEQNKLKDSSGMLAKEYELNSLKLGDNATKSQKLKLEQEYLGKQLDNSGDQVKNLSEQLQLSEKEFGSNSNEVRRLKQELADAQIEALKFQNQYKEATNSLKHMGESIGDFGDKMQSFGKKMSMAITAPVTAFGAGLVKTGVEIRKFRAQAQIYYEGLYQDTARAQQQLDDLMTFARTTPYSYESLVEADMVMQTFGMSTDKSRESLEAIANTIASTGGSNSDLENIARVFGQIESSGKASLQDMNQLVNAKIPAFKIVANELNMSVMELRENISKGEVTSDVAIQALTQGLMEGTDGINGATQAYSGSLDTVKNQLPGAIDSMKSAWKNMALGLVDDDMFNGIIEAINKITEMLNSGAFTPVIQAIGEALKSLIDLIGNLAEWFGKLSPGVQGFIAKVILFGAILGPIIVLLGSLLSAIGAIMVFMSGPAMATIIGVLPWLAALALAITAVTLVIKNWGEISEWFVNVWNAAKEKTIQILVDIGNAITSSVSFLVQFFVSIFSAIIQWFSDLWQAIADGISIGWQFILETITPLVDLFVRAIMVPISLVQVTLEAIWLLIKAGIEITWEAIKLSTEWTWKQISDYIIHPINVACNWVMEQLTALGNWIGGVWQSIAIVTQEVWNFIKESILSPIGEACEKTLGVIIDLKDGLVDRYEQLLESTKEKFNQIGEAITAPIIKAKEIIEGVVNGMRDFFKNIKFPTFSLKTNSKKVLGKEITYPAGIDVKWNAKGGIFKKPTIAGYSNGQFQGVGEAGPEAVLPLTEKVLGQIGEGIARSMNLNEFFTPILYGIERAAEMKMTHQTANENQTSPNENQVVQLLAQLLEVVRSKEFDPTIIVDHQKEQSGFAKYDQANQLLNRAKKSVSSGLVYD